MTDRTHISWDYRVDVEVPAFPALVLPRQCWPAEASDDAEPPHALDPVLSALRDLGFERAPREDLHPSLRRADALMRGERWVGPGVIAHIAWAAFVPRIELEGRGRRAWRTKVADRVPMLGLADVRALLADRETAAVCRGIGAVAFAWLFELVEAVGEHRWHGDEAVASLASTVHGELWAMQQRGVTPP